MAIQPWIPLSADGSYLPLDALILSYCGGRDVRPWIPLSADGSYLPLDALILSYCGGRDVRRMTGRDSSYRHHSVIEAAKRQFALEDHACEGVGFSGRLVELFRESGYSLWRVPEWNMSNDTGHPLAKPCHPDMPRWQACATQCSITRYRSLDSVGLHFRLQSRDEAEQGATGNYTIFWSSGTLRVSGHTFSHGRGHEINDQINEAVGEDLTHLNFVRKMLTDTDPHIRLVGEVAQIDPEARLMPEPVPADVEAPRTCCELVVSCLRGMWEGICSALCACLTCCFRSEQAE